MVEKQQGVIVINGFIKLIRLGSPEHKKQEGWQAPSRKGIWAFPHPYYEAGYTIHKYRSVMPKNLKNPTYEDVQIEESQAEWIKKNRGVLRKQEFWYQGYLYHRIPVDLNSMSEWMLCHSSQLPKIITKSRGSHFRFRDHDNRLTTNINDNLGYLEVFLPAGQGIIRTGSAPKGL